MRLGLCCDPSEAEAALAAGYDYVELPAASTMPSETTNLFFPSEVGFYDEYPFPAEKTLSLGFDLIDAAAGRGVEIMVLGSGASRRVPSSLLSEAVRVGSSEAAMRMTLEWRFFSLVKALDDYAQRYGIRVAPENLNPQETDVGTSLPNLSGRLYYGGIGFTVDAYHALVEADEPDGDLEFWRSQLLYLPTHVHFAPFDRSVPTGREASLRAFFMRLGELGYEGRASLECRRKGIPDPVPLRRLWE